MVLKLNLGIKRDYDWFKTKFVNFRLRYSRGWSLIGDYIKQPAIALTGIVYWIDYLNRTYNYNISNNFAWFFIPLWFIAFYFLGWFDQFKMKIWQKESEWGARNIDPFQKEVLERIKNIEEKVEKIVKL